MKEIDFFYFFGSAYAYLSVMRIEELAEAAGVTVRWRPFSVRALMKEEGNNLRTQPAKMRYIWRDIERRAIKHSVPYVRPPIWPTDPDLLANRVGTVAMAEGWCREYTKASFAAWFLGGAKLGDRDGLTQILKRLGKDPTSVIERAHSEEIGALYDAQTDAARSIGAFGSPTFGVDGEAFWGDDRLEEAIDWAVGRHLAQHPPAGQVSNASM